MGQGKKILISDDINVFLEMEKTLFRRHDIELIVAQNGEEVVERIASERPDLVLLDLHLQGIDGDECCRRVKSDPDLRAIPFVLMANSQWEEEIQRCRRAGCNEIILKPINKSHLLKTARELLNIADRSAARATSDITAYVGVEAGESISANCLDLSVGGAFIESRVVFPIGSHVRLLLNPEGREDAIRCKGRIAWVNSPGNPVKAGFPTGFGIQFTEIDGDDRLEIEQFIEETDG